ncbi:MAG TPA: hypothetical protein VF762_17375 [Blastocatellia bacterium]
MNNWPKIALFYLPLFIIAVDAAVLIGDRFQTEAEKAIRLVRESNSRKENFTVQQYLYSTIYNRRDKGEQVEIEGWRAAESSDPDTPMAVEFSYADAGGKHTASWAVNLKEGRVTPQNEDASGLSWH